MQKFGFTVRKKGIEHGEESVRGKVSAPGQQCNNSNSKIKEPVGVNGLQRQRANSFFSGGEKTVSAKSNEEVIWLKQLF